MIKVSVIIPLYNAESTIAECLESIFQQSLHDIEVIVINDASWIGTREAGQPL